MPFKNVINQYSEPVEIQFDAAFNPDSPYVWQPGEVKTLPEDAALFCRRKSVVKEDPITGAQVRALLVQGVDKEYDDVARHATDPKADPNAFLLAPRGPELLDRTNMSERDRNVTLLSLVNPVRAAGDQESVVPGSHARRVPS